MSSWLDAAFRAFGRGADATDRSSTSSSYAHTVVVATCAVAGCAATYIALNRFVETFVPRDWHYRPGTFSAYLAKMLLKHAKKRRKRKPIRVYMDGCFDMMHYGHANALRQAKQCGDVLVVGLIPDREIIPVKGPPVNDEKERYAMVSAVKWVDEIITDVPYNLTEDFLMELFRRHRIDYVVHGDDPCLLPDGTDAYAVAKRMGRFKMIRRTEGVSSTDIVGRMLLCSRDLSPSMSRGGAGEALAPHFADGDLPDSSGDSESDDTDGKQDRREPARGRRSNGAADAARARGERTASTLSNEGSRGGSPAAAHRRASEDSWVPDRSPPRAGGQGMPKGTPPTRLAQFLPTTHRIVQFSDDRVPNAGARIVYIDGAWDVFHPGHVAILKKAKSLGDFLLVGVHDDDAVRARRGGAPHLPIMGCHERALSVLACRYVDEVIIGAPSEISVDLLRTFGVSVVVHGTTGESSAVGLVRESIGGREGEKARWGRRYGAATEAGIFEVIESPSQMTTMSIIERILRNRVAFEAKYSKKSKGEEEYYANKGVVAES